MRADLGLGIAVAVGMVMTLAMIICFVARSRGLENGREFRDLRRPPDLMGYPPVTVVVPARNAAAHVGACLKSVLALDYPRLEIIVVDDLSTDRTVELTREVIVGSGSGRDIRLSLLGDEQPDDRVEWVYGKSRALWHGAGLARGDWLLFVDADTRQKPDTLWRALSFVRSHDLKALSMTGVSIIPNLWGEVLESVVYPAIFLVFPWRRINEPGSPDAWMNGQFILYERTAYLAVGGHRAVAASAGEDTALAILSKRNGVRSLFLPVTSAYESRDFDDLGQTFRGWTRRLASGGAMFRLPRRSYVLQAGALFFVGVWPVITAAAGLLGVANGTVIGVDLRLWAWAQLVLVVVFQAILRAVMKRSLWPSVLAPVGSAFGIGLIAAAYRARFITKSVESRGRRLPVNDHVG
jgi:cellulose synthase/poly-beta-1,6-N-acetylglucosamine synthase-like glycosyltransferase